MALRISLIGLNQTAVSIGLALQKNSAQLERIGSDADLIAEQKALHLKAIDRIIHNLHSAVEKADVIVLCLPVDEIHPTLEAIAPSLKAGAVVLDTSPLSNTVFSWAKSLLPEERYLVSFTPALNPSYITDTDESLDKASADYFQRGLIVITAPPDTHADALKLAGDLAEMIGGKPFYADPFEADGLMAMVDLLPKLTAAGLMRAAMNQPGWREGRKLAGRSFLGATEPLLHLNEQKLLGQTAIFNSDNAIRLLDALIGELEDFREMLLNQDDQALHQALNSAQQQRIQWWKDRQEALWDMPASPSILPTSGQVIGRLFGLGRRPREQGKGNKPPK
ncbi:MAG: prephenate dehydrogenase [Bellilinea sp.]|nr:MAG: prephenate dehydrogenase [Bellilinea sp.]